MKKIITAVAAVAMAASMFALDFTGALQAKSDLFNMKFAEGAQPTVLNTSLGGGGMYWGTRVQAGIYADKCGAQFAFTNGAVFVADSYNVWIQPIDAVKVQFLNCTDKINESFADAHEYKIISVKDQGLQVTLKPVDSLSFVTTFDKTWINNGVIGSTAMSVKYTDSDVGTIGLMFVGKNNFKAVELGAGYSNTFDNVSMFADVAIGLGSTGLNNLAADAQAVISADAVKFSAYVAYTNTMANVDPMTDMGLRVIAKLECAMDSCTPYLKVKSGDFLANNLNMTVTPGVTFNVGAAACELSADVTISSETGKTGISVPFTATVSF